MFKAFRKDEGFTLVELMVVVLIIGILVAIAIPIFNNASKQAKINTCKANIRTIDGALAQKATTEGVTLADLKDTTLDSLEGDYLKSVPKCPFSTTDKPIPYVIKDGSVTPHDHSK